MEQSKEGTGLSLSKTPLYPLHLELGARMCPFAGWDMPIFYPGGIVAEHAHTREFASLFDVSHMGQAVLSGSRAAACLEALMPADLRDLPVGRARLSFFLNDNAGILDDLIISRLPSVGDEDQFFLIVNAANQAADFAHLRERAPDLRWHDLGQRALIAIQGPSAADVVGKFFPQARAAPFMSTIAAVVDGETWYVSRSGYTGEDGFEISAPAARGIEFARRALADERVRPAGLGARDTLRLEAGLCLHGHDIDSTTTPVEAALEWAIAKRRRQEGGFPGAERVRMEIENGPSRRRVGLLLAGRQPAREGSDIFTLTGSRVGHVTSGGFGPTVGRAVAMGYVEPDYAGPGTDLQIEVRGKFLPAAVVKMPFLSRRPVGRSLPLT